jgi:hypothetical protein
VVVKVSRNGLALALVWLLVVAVGSTVVWAVISRAGDELVAGADPVVGTTTTPSATVSESGTPTATPSRSARPHHKPTTAAPTVRPTQHPSKHPSASASSASAAPAAVRRTWQGTGGLVVAECRGARISLYSASPDSGYSVDVGDRGPSRVKVEFRGRGERDGVKVEVASHCSGGAPVFSAERSGGDDDGGGGDDGGGHGGGSDD